MVTTQVKQLEAPSYQEGYNVPWIVSIEPLANYRIHLRYSDGIEGEVDLSHCVGTELFAEWDRPGVFEQVRIGDSGEIWWSDMASFCPDSMYMKLTGKTLDQIIQP
ncbi:MAG: DUF2442 domain-containing protein [Caldilineaceae bacterium SB0665_bin_25]|nr:DUF2442 domain-containing protein [Caldilineaceae bacterium SB0665_bin_25]